MATSRKPKQRLLLPSNGYTKMKEKIGLDILEFLTLRSASWITEINTHDLRVKTLKCNKDTTVNAKYNHCLSFS